MSMGRHAERSPRGGGARAAQADLPKHKPSLKKLWPQIKALVAPRLGSPRRHGLMVINRFAGLVLPYTSKPLLTRCSLPRIRAPTCCPFIALVFSAMVVQAITSFSLTQLLSKAGQRLIARCAVRCKGTWGCSPFPTMTRTAPARWWRAS